MMYIFSFFVVHQYPQQRGRLFEYWLTFRRDEISMRKKSKLTQSWLNIAISPKPRGKNSRIKIMIHINYIVFH